MSKLQVGDKILDSKLKRTIKLVARINPSGDILPYWQVENTATGKKTTIRENRLTGGRWLRITE